ncbi:Triosephosphate isomerase [Tilletiaria anomala UBC 951]|uniref:Triosephosphate isomerase n=1 Tax=Tilletiaria anomala (strain ATCC 24038 / CBS 436.72 / UBC 951) TaxID=1037660 RepID=A0A066WJ75_TILAU|nr:Triosephosphate isomerase [Tilletiaria anomala UBC 951]KDN52613.1 Triosephosphate isomerase [Tilletiaria anomala UBC 951]
MATSAPSPHRLVGVSTKMYFDLAKTAQYTSQVLSHLQHFLPKLHQSTDVFLIPDFLSIIPCRQAIEEFNKTASPPVPLILGAQNTHYQDAGAFTGEVSPLQLSQAGVKIVEIGHAERRRYFGETDAWVVLKAKAALRNGMTPLICIGEQKKEGGVENAVEECWQQVSGVFDDADVLKDSKSKEIVLAFEPVWAIGASEPAPAEHVVAVTKALRQRCQAAKGFEGSVRILYGGSAGPGLFDKLKDGVDGLFLGRFAHDPERFAKTVVEVGGGFGV